MAQSQLDVNIDESYVPQSIIESEQYTVKESNECHFLVY